VPFDEAYLELGDMSRAFFFYPRGLKDAIEITLATTCIPDDHYFVSPNHIICDLERWIEGECQVNTGPIDLLGLFTNVKIATELLEEYVLRQMRQLFGSSDLHVHAVEPMVGTNMHYIVTVDF